MTKKHRKMTRADFVKNLSRSDAGLPAPLLEAIYDSVAADQIQMPVAATPAPAAGKAESGAPGRKGAVGARAAAAAAAAAARRRDDASPSFAHELQRAVRALSGEEPARGLMKGG